jgi:hypothetical protein
MPPGLDVYISLTPHVSPPMPNPSALASPQGEPADIMRRAEEWHSEVYKKTSAVARSFSSSFPGSTPVPPLHVHAFVIDRAGSSTLKSRFLAPIALPPVLGRPEIVSHDVVREANNTNQPPGQLGTERHLRNLAWFVSHMTHSGVVPEDAEVWGTAEDVVRFATGGAGERATLLASLFLATGAETWIVQGPSVHSAEDYFVVTTGRFEVEGSDDASNPKLPEFRAGSPDLAQVCLWSPTTGRGTGIRNPRTELRGVDMVFSRANMWANVQNTRLPWTMSWDVSDKNAWMPFFGSATLPARALGSIQRSPSYPAQPSIFYEDLSRKLLEEVREIVTEARSSLTGANTWWDKHCESKIKSILRGASWRLNEGLRQIPYPGMSGQGPDRGMMTRVRSQSGMMNRGMLEMDNEYDDDENDPDRAWNGAGRTGMGDRGVSSEAQTLAAYPREMMNVLQRQCEEFMRREYVNYHVDGSLVHVPYGRTDDLGAMVLNTDLHMRTGEGLKYGAAVLCEPLGGQYAFPIFVFLGVMRRKTTV